MERMTKDQREKISETIGALYIASTIAATDDLKEMLATYADGLAELLIDDNKSISLSNGFGLTINAEDIARGRLSEIKEYVGYVGYGEGHGGENG